MLWMMETEHQQYIWDAYYWHLTSNHYISRNTLLSNLTNVIMHYHVTVLHAPAFPVQLQCAYTALLIK